MHNIRDHAAFIKSELPSLLLNYKLLLIVDTLISPELVHPNAMKAYQDPQALKTTAQTCFQLTGKKGSNIRIAVQGLGRSGGPPATLSAET